MKSRRVRTAAHGACVGEMKCTYSISVRHPEEDKALERLKHRKYYNIKINFKE
jgi:hypothetical protein